MNYKIEVKKTLKTDNKKSFGLNDDIAFSLLNQESQPVYYIGRIIEILDDSIVIEHIECKDKDVEVPERMTVKLESIVENSCCYCYCD